MAYRLNANPSAHAAALRHRIRWLRLTLWRKFPAQREMLCSALAGVQMKAAFELSIATVATIAHLAHRHEANKRALCDASAAAVDSPLFRTLVRMLESASTYSPSALQARHGPRGQAQAVFCCTVRRSYRAQSLASPAPLNRVPKKGEPQGCGLSA